MDPIYDSGEILLVEYDLVPESCGRYYEDLEDGTRVYRDYMTMKDGRSFMILVGIIENYAAYLAGEIDAPPAMRMPMVLVTGERLGKPMFPPSVPEFKTCWNGLVGDPSEYKPPPRTRVNA